MKQLGCAIAGVYLTVLAPAAEPERVLRAGAAIIDITPPTGTRINGNFWPIVSTDVHDRLHARCLVLDDGKTKLAFAIADNCLIPRDVFDAAKRLVTAKTGIPPECIMMSATHTHSAGAVVDCYLTDADPDYRESVPAKFADGIAEAAKHLSAAEVGWGSVPVPGQVFCRRWLLKPGTMPENPFGSRDDKVKMNPPVGSPDLDKPAGPVDPEVSFLSLRGTDGKAIAVLANYSLHYVGDVGPGHLSADYYGVFADKLRDELAAGPGFVGIMSNGTSGNINNIDFRGNDPRPQGNYQRINLVGAEVARAVAGAVRTAEHRPWVALRHAQIEHDVGVRKPTAAEVDDAKTIAQGRPPALFKNLKEVYARETLLLNDYPDSVRQIIQAFRLGDLVIGGIPNEVFSETGLALKKESPLKPYFTISLANGWNGYLPPKEQHALGGYETWRSRTSYLEVTAEAKIREAMLGVIAQLK